MQFGVHSKRRRLALLVAALAAIVAVPVGLTLRQARALDHPTPTTPGNIVVWGSDIREGAMGDATAAMYGLDDYIWFIPADLARNVRPGPADIARSPIVPLDSEGLVHDLGEFLDQPAVRGGQVFSYVNGRGGQLDDSQIQTRTLYTPDEVFESSLRRAAAGVASTELGDGSWSVEIPPDRYLVCLGISVRYDCAVLDLTTSTKLSAGSAGVFGVITWVSAET
jgi:hypothetical protein